MKTTIQELIKELKQKRDMWNANGSATERRVRGAYVDAIVTAKNLIEKEKQQIIDAYTAGEIRPYNGIKYYDSTFGDSNEAGI